MSAETSGPPSRFGYWRFRFRAWRWRRPFWAGLLTLLAGLPIAYFPYANLTLGQLSVRMATTAGSGSLIIGVLLLTLGLTMWFQPVVRVFAGVASILLALVALVISNFGGFLLGFLLGLVGGALSVSWAPGEPAAESGPDPAELPDPETGPESDKYDADVAGTDEGAQETVEANGRHSAG
ncbi:DUF6114 domain-containing protein [Actinacidiphila oryziradicis]|uniref:DUF6114 domain-containing protein n=1 Tax=Actinacidiphila oryziradicis TaxID=2571141 RepID=UPI001FE39381|nr:DUF6114 domain-containing protein [Actinacidiphila oryziradicis]